jgi:hypothetical protein
VSDKNSILLSRESQYFGIGNSFQPGVISRHKIYGWFVATATFDDGMIKSASARKRIIAATPFDGASS